GGEARLLTARREGCRRSPTRRLRPCAAPTISIALIANKFDLKYVMDQVGHGDSTMTMDVYSQLQKRYKRSHGVNFDRIVSEASGQVKVLPLAAAPLGAASPPRSAQQKPAGAAAGPGPRPGTRSRA